MLDLFTILTEGGIVLWSKSYVDDCARPQATVNSLISNLLDGRSGDQSFSTESYTLRWTFANDLGLIFVVVWQKIITLSYIPELLETIKRLFCSLYGDHFRGSTVISPRIFTNFESRFDAILERYETNAASERKKKPRAFEQTRKYQNSILDGSKKLSQDAKQVSQQTDHIAKNLDALNQRGLSARNTRLGKPLSRKSSKSSSPKDSPTASDNDTRSKERKQMRKWGDSYSETDAKELDYSSSTIENGNVDVSTLIDEKSMGSKSKGQYNVVDLGADEENGEDLDIISSTPGTSQDGIFGLFKKLTGGKVLKAEDLEPALANMREHLMKKNVAAEVASHLCQSVEKTLVGQKIGSLQSYSRVVRDSMELAIRQILTPTLSVDLLRDISASRSQKKPFNICFIGVNGVGKSTNLAKTCFWLLQNDLRVLIAACDTFRSGAVEQLRVHVRNLKALDKNATVDIFERGYGKDAAGIANDAISYATLNGYDVVMIDTAGRMQDNVPLMRSLAKLVSTNDISKIVFVGEALVGNEGVDQLSKFNQALKDYSGMSDPRTVDFLLISKWDTVDDKIGAALSMTYTSRASILFLGVGQTYTDLRAPNARHITNLLLRP